MSEGAQTFIKIKKTHYNAEALKELKPKCVSPDVFSRVWKKLADISQQRIRTLYTLFAECN
jgi:macrodomain Ter protein organizer (MatP/YcbG family)